MNPRSGIMKISQITANPTTQALQKRKMPAFRQHYFLSSRALMESLENKGSIYNYERSCRSDASRLFVGNCYNIAGEIYKKIFPNKSLPKYLYYEPLIDSYGMYYPDTKNVGVNSSLECFENKISLTKEMEKQKNVFFLPDKKSTTHYLRTFIHEFGHNAHHCNLEENGHGDAIHVLRDMTIPTVLGRFITKFKLGKYSAQNMVKFMAERMTKDICKNLNSDDEFIGNTSDLDYSSIFSRKWNCRYVTPQSYLDYYTQQVWNGNLEGANKVLNDMEEYMAVLEKSHAIEVVEIERPRSVTVPIEIVTAPPQTATEPPKTVKVPVKIPAPVKQKTFWGLIDAFCGSIFKTPLWLDNRNKLKIGEDE